MRAFSYSITGSHFQSCDKLRWWSHHLIRYIQKPNATYKLRGSLFIEPGLLPMEV